MQAWYAQSAVKFVTASFVRVARNTHKNVIHWYLATHTRTSQKGDDQGTGAFDYEPDFQAYQTDDELPNHLPEGCPGHLVLAPERIPAMLLTQELFDRIVDFAEDFRRVQKLEHYAEVEHEMFKVSADWWHKTVSSLQAERDHMIKMREQQSTQEIWRHGRVELSFMEIERLQRKIDEMVDAREGFYQQGVDSREALERLRRVTITDQFRLSEMLCKILEDANVLSSAEEQWINDRRSLRTKTLRLMHVQGNETKKFPFAESHIWNDWKTEDGTFSEEEEQPSELIAAIDNFEMCHWNRRVARHEFARRRHIVEEVQKTRPKAYLLDQHALANAELIGIKHGMQLTANLIKADTDYRNAVRELRENGQSVDTLDSSYIPSVASNPPRMDYNYSWDRLEDAARKPLITEWNAAVRDNSSPGSIAHLRPSASEDIISMPTAEMEDCFSGDFNEIWNTNYSAMRQRAWTKLRARRDRKVLSKRKRWRIGSGSDRPSASSTQEASKASRRRNGPPKMRNLPGHYGMSDFPDGPPPKYRRDDTRNSFPSDPGSQPE